MIEDVNFDGGNIDDPFANPESGCGCIDKCNSAGCGSTNTRCQIFRQFNPGTVSA